MSKFKLKRGNATPEVSTASLPDIVFMLLFFFMTVTVMKDDVLKVSNELPNATEIKKLEKKDRLITIYIGKPTKSWEVVAGGEPKIQVGDKFIDAAEVGDYVLGKIHEMPEHVRPFVTVSLKVDKKANMGLVSDVKEELRKVHALKVNYTTYDGDAFLNLNN
jgi:biopolymer transport protein ExbD